ncbi:MAG: FAD-dependent oxidoreductase [Fuerstiella sp.]
MASRNLVLLGVGHTNAHVVKEWRKNPITDCSLTCISQFSTATYSGMLPGTLGHQYRDDEMQIDLQSLCEQAGARLIIADTNGLDLNSRAVLFADHDSIPFDALSIGVGSVPAGYEACASAKSVVPTKPMQTFSQRWQQRLHDVGDSKNRVSDIVIVGGGVASVEIACCLQQQCRRLNDGQQPALSIFTRGSKLASDMTSRSVKKIERLLMRKGIDVHYGSHVTEIGEGCVVTADGRRHPADAVVWATGAAAAPVLEKLDLRTDERGFIATSNTLQSFSDERIFAVGDAGTIVASPSAKAGVYAVRQCPVLWQNLRAVLDGGPLATFEPQSDFLKLLNTGDGKALLQYGRISVHAGWCWHLKTWIDRRFVSAFQRSSE